MHVFCKHFFFVLFFVLVIYSIISCYPKKMIILLEISGLKKKHNIFHFFYFTSGMRTFIVKKFRCVFVFLCTCLILLSFTIFPPVLHGPWDKKKKKRQNYKNSYFWQRHRGNGKLVSRGKNVTRFILIVAWGFWKSLCIPSLHFVFFSFLIFLFFFCF